MGGAGFLGSCTRHLRARPCRYLKVAEACGTTPMSPTSIAACLQRAPDPKALRCSTWAAAGRSAWMLGWY
jgi:hypothetical protein